MSDCADGQIGGSVVALYFISPTMTLVTVAVLPVIIVAGTLFGALLRTMSRAAQTQSALSTAIADEALDNIRTVRAFGQEDEGLLIAKIRRSDGFDPSLSLVAEIEGDVVGHILFSRIYIETESGDVPALALAPMAVLPNHQNRGIGSQLVRTGLDISRQAGHAIVVVLGHPDYYPRFGFQQASQVGVRSPFDVPDDVFMVQGLIPGALDAGAGLVRYPAAFDGV